ncbi:ACT domain-containing protein [Pseudomonas resinovorans]|uniref:ACT domain-containing protein n=1 Tax=Metapseudomonas resinovorans TaxID=53412 RepID=A0ABT4Y0W2_METRE|nr:ACT domain-containing protein [Pseudomonas resinovorans]MDA8482474.1 ACT domain-containing protein [Pseudomonas resinovorans]
MAGETALSTLIRNMSPQLNPGQYVFCTLDDAARLQDSVPLGTFREQEGLTVILERDEADRLGLSYDYTAAWITLQVHSSLSAVGLTATFAAALAQAGVSCNVVAGYFHDHLFVASEDAERAVSTLRALAANAQPE